MIIHTDPTSPSGKRFELTPDEFAAGLTCAFVTGPIGGTIGMADGSAYDVTDDVIPVRGEHVAELQLAIHKSHHAAGRFLDAPLPNA